MINSDIKYTVRDYMSLPESETDRYELIDGEIIKLESRTTRHNVLGRLMATFHHFVRSRRLGELLASPLDVILSDNDVFQPDLLFISNDRRAIAKDANIQGAPDLVVEVLAPDTEDRDRNIKRETYAKYGVREYWIVDLDAETIEVTKAGRSGLETVGVYTIGADMRSSLLPELELDLANVFEDNLLHNGDR